MGIFNFGKKDEETNFFDFVVGAKNNQLKQVELAIEHAADTIAKTISKSDIKVFRYDTSTKKTTEKEDDIHYRLNIRANANQDSTTFFYNVVHELLTKSEALIVTTRKPSDVAELYLAESWETDNRVMNGKKYRNVVVTDGRDSHELNRVFNADDVIYLTLGNSKITKLLEEFKNEMNAMIDISAKNYKTKNTRKWRLKVPGNPVPLKDPNTKEPISYEDYKERLTKGLLNSGEEGIVMLSEYFDLTLLGDGKDASSKDYLELIKEAKDNVAMTFGIPLDVFYGSKTDKSTGTDDYITFAVAPILEILADGFNGKLIAKEDYLKGERIVIDTFKMKHFDIMDVAGSLDKLTGIGFSHNDLRGFLNLPKVDEDWANEHNLTKNYARITKGGNANE